MTNELKNGMFLLNKDSETLLVSKKPILVESQLPIIESIIETIVEPIIFKC